MMFVLQPVQAGAIPSCDTAAERKLEIEKLDESVDWFLSIVEEVPEGIARQFRDAAVDWRRDEKALNQAIAHPLWAAHVIREAGADIKRTLRPTHDTPVAHLKAAISALGQSASFRGYLSDYEARDRGRGRRIINVDDWIRRYHLLSFDLQGYARCLVDPVSLGPGFRSPTAPR
jgi:hypothetical protein